MLAGNSSKRLSKFAGSIYLVLFVLGSLAPLGCNRVRGSEVTAAQPADAPPEISCLGRIVAGDGALKIAGPAQAIVTELRVHRDDQPVAGGELQHVAARVAVPADRLRRYSVLRDVHGNRSARREAGGDQGERAASGRRAGS